jgi:hypothetical protein
MVKGSPELRFRACCIDDVYSFFIHCYHIKDWLKNDSDYNKHSNKEIETYINQTQALAICADICNGLKHLKLESSRSGSAPRISNKDVFLDFIKLDDDNALLLQKISVTIEHDGKQINAFDISTQAIQAWTKFLEPL